MAEDFNINIRNGMGKGGKPTSALKISARGSIERARQTVVSKGLLKQGMSTANKTIGNISSGSAPSTLKSVGKSSAILGVILTTGERVASFGINYKTAQTGNQVWSHNARTTLKTISTSGMNYVYGFLQNEIFTKQTIHRQNEGLDYGRELYNINVEGTKNKRI